MRRLPAPQTRRHLSVRQSRPDTGSGRQPPPDRGRCRPRDAQGSSLPDPQAAFPDAVRHNGRVRWVRWASLVALLPVAVSLSLVTVCCWLAMWTTGNLAWAIREQSAPALTRAVDGASLTAEVASWVASGWGALEPAIHRLEAADDVAQQLSSFSEAGSDLAPVITSLIGWDTPRHYLLCGLNDAELFGSGGAPLTAAVVRLFQTRSSFLVSGSTSTGWNPGNEPYRWDAAGGLPWYQPGAKYPFANSNFHPDFRISGRNMMSAWNALDLPHVPDIDGVATVDVVALAAVLRATGPIAIEGYGQIDADNVSRVLLVDSYRDYRVADDGANERRRELNAALQAEVIDRLHDPKVLLRAAWGLWQVAPGRHIQFYLPEPEAQSALAALGVDGALAQPVGDVLGAFLQSGPSKLATFQREQITHAVEIRQDGAARVEQRFIFTNAVPDALAGDPDSYRGYLALTYRQRVAFRIPSAAIDPEVRIDDREPIVRPSATGPYADGSGAKVLWQGQDIPPGQSSETVVTYSMPVGTFGRPGRIEYRVTADPQPTANPPTVLFSVRFPVGATPGGHDVGWTVEGATATWTGTLDRPLALSVAS